MLLLFFSACAPCGAGNPLFRNSRVVRGTSRDVLRSAPSGLTCATGIAVPEESALGRRSARVFPQHVPGCVEAAAVEDTTAALMVMANAGIKGGEAGTGLNTIMNLIGMMASGLAIDAAGFLGIEKKPVTFRKIAGMLLMLAGTALISFL